MSAVYFDCFAGISGDMVLGALIDAGGDRSVLDAAVEALRLGDEVDIDVRREQRGHLGGTRVLVATKGGPARTVPALRAALEDAQVPDGPKAQALRALGLLAKVESDLHHTDESRLHLHELGGADTLVDLLGSFWLLNAMGVERIYASPLPAPRGRHGDLPLPAPASVRVLAGTGAAFEESDAARELVTPTGAAILAAASLFERPAMKLHAIGYGLGARDVPGNALAAWIGDEVPTQLGVTVIETNLDDMAPNLVAALVDDLMAAGALDVTVTPVLMKKGRLGQVVSVMADAAHVGSLIEKLLRESTTLGVRLNPVQRVIAGRRVQEIKTSFGAARVKIKELGGKAVDVAPEYEDCRRLARESGRPLREVMRVVAEEARRQLGLG
ncbi:MAG TPA: nickel pincer cofactor biosynthesis protein LarC [Candidatus Dormibacteraeota bacterium]|nr:nickel pincer cofactor biosynthesis protein LarC [Candidatus Dormibacteraeota bacterium]